MEFIVIGIMDLKVWLCIYKNKIPVRSKDRGKDFYFLEPQEGFTMGSSQAKFDERTIRDFEETTPFNRAEIAHTFGHFVELYELYQNSPECDHDRPHHIRTGRGFANPDCELPVEFIANNFTKLHCNPFRTRICNAFCTSDSGWMCFTEFVDMVSSFSPKADLEKKIFHAFQIFDFNGDGLLKRDDLYKMIDLMTHNSEWIQEIDTHHHNHINMTYVYTCNWVENLREKQIVLLY